MSEHLSDADIARLRRKLETTRDTLLAAERANQDARRGSIATETDAGDAADVAERAIEQDAALRIARFDATLLAEVQRALAKIEAGTYGVSEESGDPIDVERLEAVPWARRTVEEEERHQGRTRAAPAIGR